MRIRVRYEIRVWYTTVERLWNLVAVICDTWFVVSLFHLSLLYLHFGNVYRY